MKNQALPIIAGGIAGALYFNVSESSVPKESDANYLTTPLTDILAWTFGSYLIWRGMIHKDSGVTFIGSAMIGIHMSQFAAHKVLKHRI